MVERSAIRCVSLGKLTLGEEPAQCVTHTQGRTCIARVTVAWKGDSQIESTAAAYFL